MPNTPLDTTLLDKAIIFATKAHQNTERRGKGFPYIVHPLEAVTIVATMTPDQELLAAAALHDVIEDTDVTYEEVEKEFGKRIADLVQSETQPEIPNLSYEESWKQRREIAIAHLKTVSIDAKMVALGDKLSNMRAIFHDYMELGDTLWSRFHVSDPALQGWYYRSLAEALNDLQQYPAYHEFVELIDRTFPKVNASFTFEKKENEIVLKGYLDGPAINGLAPVMEKGVDYLLNFEGVTDINFAGLRSLLFLKDNGYRFVLRQLSENVARRFDVSGVSSKISILRQPVQSRLDHFEQSGDGYTAVTYFDESGDCMSKLYYEFVNSKEVEREKRYSTAAMLLGIATPISGDLIKIDGKTGILFERIQNKVSFAREYSNHPEKIEELAKDFAELSKKLHSTPCDTSVFPNAKLVYHGFADRIQGLTSEEVARIHAFIDGLADVTTCLHGDYHIGNAILTDKGEKLWIDMGDFSYGDPLIDIGTMYFITHGHLRGDKTPERLFHTSNENLYRFWQAFIRYYFPGQSEEELEQLIRPYAALTVIHFAVKARQSPWMAGIIKQWLLGE